VSGVLTGPVTIDLKGFTLTGSGNFSSGPAAIAITALNQYLNDFPITVQNGTVTFFVLGLNALNETGNITIKNVTFLRDVRIQFSGSGGNLVKSCDFIGPAADNIGIHRITDSNDRGADNYYDSVTFNKINRPLTYRYPGATIRWP
jgi:hypothetical protein